MSCSFFRSIFAALAFLVSAPALADQTAYPHYDTRFRDTYWSELFPKGGEELYCGYSFDTPSRGHFTPRGMSLEHAYPAQWMVEALHCGRDREECRRKDKRFGYLEADMHNLFPADRRINSARSDLLFGEIPGEERRHRDRDEQTCDFENDTKDGIAEPRPAVRGNLARAIFYMIREYGLPIDRTMLSLLLQWHQADPADHRETQLNDRIEELQGNRNPFIDDPKLARKVFSQ